MSKSMAITAAGTMDEIKKAIAEHSMWKARVNEAIDTRSSPISVSHASLDHICNYGKWLHDNLDLRMFNPKHYDKAKKLHLVFHQELGSVLYLALAGKRLEAKERCAHGGAFAAAQAALIAELTSWQRDLARFGR